MKQLILKEILPHINGSIVKGSADTIIKRVVLKPEKVKSNTLYFHFGNRYTNTRICRFDKTSVIVTERPENILSHSQNAVIVKVADVQKAYWRFVDYYRSGIQIPIIGVTGTCGKTTTTEMIKQILSHQYKTVSNYDGNNSRYRSLPYLLSIDNRVEAAVFEMGVGRPGDLTYTCKHYKPQIGVLMNIGTYHLLHCKTQENYINAKAELLRGLQSKGTLILNSDDKNIKKIDLTPFKGNILYFGLSETAQFKVRDIKYAREGMEFTLLHQSGTYPVYVPGYGKHNVYNALAAIAACHSVGIPIDKIVKRLAKFRHVRWHMQLRKGIGGCTVIDDTWNCTPPSMESGLEVLKTIGRGKKTVAVMGYMPLLGAAGYSEYFRIGEKVAKSGIDYIVLIGRDPKAIGIRAVKKGFDKSRVFYCSSAEELYKILLPLSGKDTVMLFKFPFKYKLSRIPEYVKFKKDFICEKS